MFVGMAAFVLRPRCKFNRPVCWVRFPVHAIIKQIEYEQVNHNDSDEISLDVSRQELYGLKFFRSSLIINR